jgi:hypothetical protein
MEYTDEEEGMTTTPTQTEIEARAKGDYEKYLACLRAQWVADGDNIDHPLADWNTGGNDRYWNAWRADAQKTLTMERE